MVDPITVGAAAGAAGAWAWEAFGKELVGKLAGTISKASKERWDRFGWQKAAEAYRQEMARQYGTTRILGKSDPVPLEEIYTDVYILDKPTARQRFDLEKLIKQGADRFRRPHKGERLEGLGLVKAGGNLFILGQPGAGKTTFLKYVVLQAVAGAVSKVPIFVSLKEWSDTGLAELLPFISQQFEICGFPEAEPFIEQLLKAGRAIVLFDGLDEVNLEGDRRASLTRLLNNFARQYHPSQCLITCRIAASDYLFDNFQDVEVADFTMRQIEAYVDNWFGDNETKKKAFRKNFYHSDNEGLRELAASPLLLSLLCLAFDETMTFPRRRVELYEEALEALLKKWDSSRNIRRDEIYRQLTPRFKQRMLARIAAETFEKKEYFIRRGRLERLIEAYLAKLPPDQAQGAIDGSQVLKAVEAQHGIWVERARGIYAFSHLTFQEYLTARYIADNEKRGTTERLIKQHLTDDGWYEVFLMTASLLDEADEFFDLIQGELDNFIAGNAEVLRLFGWVEEMAQQAQARGSLLPLTLIKVGYLVIGLLDTLSAMASPEVIASNISGAISYASSIIIGFASDITGNIVIFRDSASKTIYAMALDSLRAITTGSADSARDSASLRAITIAIAIEGANDINRDQITNLGFNLNEAQLERIASYVVVADRLLDCLALAYVSDRAAIESRVLAPPKKEPAS